MNNSPIKFYPVPPENPPHEPNGKGEPPKDDGTGFGFLILMLFVVFIVCFIVSIKSIKTYYDLSKLEKDGVQTTTTFVQRVEKPGGRSQTYYYLRYGFENQFARSACVIDKETRTTPKNKACKVTYRKQPITEAEYKSISPLDKMDVLYLPSDKKSRSLVIGLSYGKKDELVRIFFILAAMFLSFIFFFIAIAKSTEKRTF